MTALLIGHDKTVADWVGRVVGKPFYEPYTAIGILRSDGTLCGGYVFNCDTGDSIELSLAGRVADRSAWRAILSYVFEQSPRSRLQVHTRRSNRAVRRQAVRLGFHFEGVSRRLYGREDGLAYSLTRDDLAEFRKRWRL